MTVYVFYGPGTWECKPSNMLQAPLGMTGLVSNYLPDGGFEQWSIGYTAGYGDRASYLNSVNDLIRKLKAAILETPDDPSTLIFLVGYSQGGTGCGDVARDIANGLFKIGRRRFLHYYGIADPGRASRDYQAGPPVRGVGITGERPSTGDTSGHITQFVAPGDIIAATIHKDTLFEYIVPLTTKFWVGDTLQWAAYVGALFASREWLDKIRKDFPGIGGLLEFRRRRKNTTNAIANYIFTGVHTKYGTYEVSKGRTVADYIANDVQHFVNSVSR